jgi:hypothetical protein
MSNSVKAFLIFAEIRNNNYFLKFLVDAKEFIYYRQTGNLVHKYGHYKFEGLVENASLFETLAEAEDALIIAQKNTSNILTIKSITCKKL